MRVVSWNCRGAIKSSAAWEYFLRLAPDVALLQEVGALPDAVRDAFGCEVRVARGKTGKHQRFSTAVLARCEVVPLPIRSSKAWVNDALDHFDGNVVGCRVKHPSGSLVAVSVYSPAWFINARWVPADTEDVGLQLGRGRVWVADLVRDAIRDMDLAKDDAVVGGDLNLSESFDLWRGGPHGNAEYLGLVKQLGFVETVRHRHGVAVPTFRNARGGKVVHQMDHLFVTPSLLDRVTSCEVGDRKCVFDVEPRLSDHLPIVVDFAPAVG